MTLEYLQLASLELPCIKDAAVEDYHNKPRPLESPTSKYHAVDEIVGISSFMRLSEQYSSKQQLNKSVSVIIRKATEKIKTSLTQLKYEISPCDVTIEDPYFSVFYCVNYLKFLKDLKFY